MFGFSICILTNLIAVLANPLPQIVNDLSIGTEPLPVGESSFARVTSPAEQPVDVDDVVSVEAGQNPGCIPDTSTGKLSDDDRTQTFDIFRRESRVCPIERPNVKAPVPRRQQSGTRPDKSANYHSPRCKAFGVHSVLVTCQGPEVDDEYTTDFFKDYADIVVNCVIGKSCFHQNSVYY